MFLAPRTVSDSSTLSGADLEKASRQRVQERAQAVANPNLKWKPYRPAAKADAKPATAETKATTPGRKSSSTVRKAQATNASRRANKIATQADESSDAPADEQADRTPARRTAARASRARLRSEILQVGQREKPEKPGAFDNSFDVDSNSTTEPEPEPAPATGNETESEAPRTISPLDEPFPEESLPMPSGQAEGNYAPPGQENFGEPTSPAEILNCDVDKRECGEALQRLKATTIDKINVNIAVAGTEGSDFPCECELNGTFVDRNWSSTLFSWKASSLCHKPLYFEEVGLERYGHSVNPLWQPIFSG
ncbi:MAG TPA: hypothetical protein VGG30_09865, partial [Pirellulales bacterium]